MTGFGVVLGLSVGFIGMSDGEGDAEGAGLAKMLVVPLVVPVVVPVVNGEGVGHGVGVGTGVGVGGGEVMSFHWKSVPPHPPISLRSAAQRWCHAGRIWRAERLGGGLREDEVGDLELVFGRELRSRRVDCLQRRRRLRQILWTGRRLRGWRDRRRRCG